MFGLCAHRLFLRGYIGHDDEHGLEAVIRHDRRIVEIEEFPFAVQTSGHLVDADLQGHHAFDELLPMQSEVARSDRIVRRHVIPQTKACARWAKPLLDDRRRLAQHLATQGECE